MIQRIQTLYLLGTALFLGFMTFMPLAHYLSGGEEYILTSCGPATGGPESRPIAMLPYLGILAVLSAILPLITIFLYRKRLLQIRMCIVELVLLFGMMILTGYYLYHGAATFGAAGDYAAKYSFVNGAPLAGLILTWLATRAIGRDEALIRSVDRIR